MAASTFTLAAPDGTALFVHRWLPDAPPRGVVQIVHGLAEHGARYARVAAALNAAGYGVYAADLRGHGQTARSADDLGFFAAADGWARMVEDVWQLERRIAADHPGLPIVLLGHSMGSFVAQQLAAEHGEAFAGVVLSATNGKPAALASLGRLVARVERLRLGAHGRSALIDGMTFGAFNKRFQPTRTAFDWLSRDPAEVDKYVADPRCGFPATVQLWIDLLDALPKITDPARQARIPKRLPIWVIAGTRDPVSDDTKGILQLLAAYRAAGLERVEHRFYEGARHEILNETNRDEVTANLIGWLDRVAAGSN